MSRSNKLTMGIDRNFDPDVENAILGSSEEGYDFVCLDLIDKSKNVTFLKAQEGERLGDKTDPKFMLDSQDWSNFVVGKISSYDGTESGSHANLAAADNAILNEINYCAYLGLPAFLISVDKNNCVQMARLINYSLLNSHHIMTVWVRIVGDKSNESAWKTWNQFRTLCNHSSRVGLALELSCDLPDVADIKKWLGEPVRSVFLPTSIFMSNKKGYPVLSKAHQSVIMQFFSIKCQVVITGPSNHDLGMKVYQQYIYHLYSVRPDPDQYQIFSEGYEDYLQSPLQPLMDNLESATYEVFEKDPVKYRRYQEAIYKCLEENFSNSDKPIVVMVVGAGRGPLVKAALKASKDANIKIKCYAVEKNVNATVTLQLLKRTVWTEDDVTIVASDMREWKAPELADIVVSELLGSFGDNELSPECLDGTERFLKPGAFSIPCSYTSYLAPVSSQKLYNEVSSAANLEKDKPKITAFEMPYVVRIHNFFELAEPQAVFTFKHPSGKTDEDDKLKNSRYIEMKFNISEESLLHGFAGYFECQLYKDIDISILPKTHSPGMFSWFPIFFPIYQPMHLRGQEDLVVNLWRVCSSQKVWYEWAVSAPTAMSIHNPGGRSYTIGL